MKWVIIDVFQVPILVLANKQDLPGAKHITEIEKILGIAELGNTHLWFIQVGLKFMLSTKI